MDYDITESMMSSWLKYVKNCQIVETNWHYVIKNEIKDSFEDFINKLLSELGKKGRIVYYKKIEKEESRDGREHEYKLTLSNLLKQIEIDCLGISLTENTIYAVETAFHSSGLGYKQNENKLISKALRTLIAMYYFKKNISNKKWKVEYYFVTPTVKNKDIVENVCEDKEKIENEFNKYGDGNYNIKLICGKYEFIKEIIEPLLNNDDNSTYKKNNDNSAVFLRACKLLDSVEYLNRNEKRNWKKNLQESKLERRNYNNGLS